MSIQSDTQSDLLKRCHVYICLFLYFTVRVRSNKKGNLLAHRFYRCKFDTFWLEKKRLQLLREMALKDIWFHLRSKNDANLRQRLVFALI